ncbi:glutathione gamma-glutamylcysteinyltransferase [Aureococcus anophagefferens]|uniref:glutathione gamma-glutamylcysteinyltransferase n=3 Tax=Aureococcus anophagefferens TaxID=44056 RepID=A0ABR1FS09_AURAN
MAIDEALQVRDALSQSTASGDAIVAVYKDAVASLEARVAGAAPAAAAKRRKPKKPRGAWGAHPPMVWFCDRRPARFASARRVVVAGRSGAIVRETEDLASAVVVVLPRGVEASAVGSAVVGGGERLELSAPVAGWASRKVLRDCGASDGPRTTVWRPGGDDVSDGETPGEEAPWVAGRDFFEIGDADGGFLGRKGVVGTRFDGENARAAVYGLSRRVFDGRRTPRHEAVAGVPGAVFARGVLSAADGSMPEFYKRPLPDSCVAFDSKEGRAHFESALSSGGLENFFVLAPQFQTQNEPAFCGLATLAMALNALQVDPGRVWKGVWRWYDESLLSCCKPLVDVEKEGIVLEEFVCLARCNGLEAALARPDAGGFPVAAFRDAVADACARTDVVLAASYSRKTLGQTGDGHFSCVGGYDRASDAVLLLDVARFKYPPHWVPLPLLLDAMGRPDAATGRPRGWIRLTRAAEAWDCPGCERTKAATILDRVTAGEAAKHTGLSAGAPRAERPSALRLAAAAVPLALMVAWRARRGRPACRPPGHRRRRCHTDHRGGRSDLDASRDVRRVRRGASSTLAEKVCPVAGGSLENRRRPRGAKGDPAYDLLSVALRHEKSGMAPPLFGTSADARFWLCLDCCGLSCACASQAIILSSMYAVSGDLAAHGGGGWATPLNLAAFNAVGLLASVSHLRAMLSDPGAVPKRATPLARDEERARLAASAASGYRTRAKGWCHRCCSYKPPRAHHDSVTNRCIVKMDHYCPWTNNAIGVRNHKFFILFILYTFLLCAYALLILFSLAMEAGGPAGSARSRRRRRRGDDAPPRRAAAAPRFELAKLSAIAVTFAALLFGLFTACMLGDQWSVLRTNVAKIDRLKGEETEARRPTPTRAAPALPRDEKVELALDDHHAHERDESAADEVRSRAKPTVVSNLARA